MKKKEKQKQTNTTNAIKITNEYSQGNIPYSSTIKTDFSRINDQILSEIKNELFCQKNEIIINNFKSIVKMIEIDIIEKCSKEKSSKITQDMISKKFAFLLSHIQQREKENDEIKSKAIDTLSNYLNQLNVIIFNYFLLNRFKEETENKDQFQAQLQCKGGEELDEKFVVLINMLSKLIKSYTSKAQLISRLFNDLLKKMNEQLLYCKTLSTEIYIQSSNNNKGNIKKIQTNGVYLNETLESVLSFQSEITNKSLSIESNHSSFYIEAKDIFRKLKALQSELKEKGINKPIVTNSNYGNNEGNQYIRTESPRTQSKPYVNLCLKQKKLMSRSTDHFNNSQKIYLNNINNSFNESFVLNTSPANTDSQNMGIYLNNTDSGQIQEGLHLNEIITINDLLKKNKCLQTEVDNLNNTMTKNKFERKRLKKELAEIKKDVEKKHYNFSPSLDTVTRYNDLNNTKSNHSKNDYLAKRIIDFMKNMKDLQDSICKKEENVAQKKKDFEKKKKELFNLASNYKEKITVSSSIEKEEEIEEKEIKKEESDKEINELKEQNNQLLAELEIKKAEIIRIQETNVKKQNETKKFSIPMAKLKEFENIIKSLKSQLDPLKEEKSKLNLAIDELKKENLKLKQEPESKKIENELNQYKDKYSFLKTFSMSLVNKINNIHNMLTPEKQQIEDFMVTNEIDKDDIVKIDIINSEIIKFLLSLLLEHKPKQQQESISSTVTPIKTTHDELLSHSQSQLLIEENRKLKALFEECMSSIYSSIKENVPEMFDEEDDLSFNYGSGLNTPVNLLDSNNSNRNQCLIATTIDKENIQGAVEMFKKYNTYIHSELNKLKEEKQKLNQENELLQLRSETYKSALEESKKINPNLNEKEFIINFNKDTKKFSLQDIANIPSEINPNNAISMIIPNEELVKENERLNNQIKSLTEELKIKTQAFNEFLKKDTKSKDITTPCVNSDYNFKDVYLKAEERINELEEQYETLVKEVLNGEVDEENKVNQNKKDNNNNLNFMQMINSHHLTHDNDHLNKNLSSKLLGVTDENHNIEENEELLLTQLNTIKIELKEQREQNKELKEEIDTLKRNSNESVQLKRNNDFVAPIKSALEKLILEITVTVKIKELFSVILKFIGCTDEEITKVFLEKDKKKQHKRLFS